MRSTAKIVLTACLLVLAGAALATLINDGSFELGPPPDSGWIEVANAPCERIGIFSGSWYVTAYEGDYDYWAGGTCYDDDTGEYIQVTGYVTQDLEIPVDETLLTFYYVSYRAVSDDVPLDGDRAYLSVNDTDLWTLPLIQANNSYPSWIGPVEIDLGDYAGQVVELKLGAVSEGEANGNIRFDYIELRTDYTATARSNWSTVKALY